MKKVIAVVGSTGIGKSKLAIELARCVGGEVVNADAMQIYKGLDISTNKIPISQQQGIPHHLIGCLDIDSEITVHQFVEYARDAIDDISARGRVPIVVGGTHYYIQSLLVDNVLSSTAASTLAASADVKGESFWPSPDTRDLIVSALESGQSNVMHTLLEEIDPDMARKWHVNDRRKIARSLEYILETGSRYSDHLKKSMETHSARYDALILCLACEKTALNSQLDRRVDQMIEGGLFSELRESYRYLKSRHHGDLDFNRGILQTIGFKEFYPWLQGDKSVSVQQCIEKMKVSTRQYARRQVKWLRSSLFPLAASVRIPSFVLAHTCTADRHIDMSRWADGILKPAEYIAGLFLNNSELPQPESICGGSISDYYGIQGIDGSGGAITIDKLSNWTKTTCELCGITTNGPNEWKQHINSRKHRKTVELRNSPQWEYILRAKKNTTSREYGDGDTMTRG